mmetsp:Transcript_61738/g.139748  ORF Transcript_61738/g.139748 Transcript_61738/m.139748 type:complete len:200 (-) Transcript_61738:227-826(-)
MRPRRVVLDFLDATLRRCQKYPRLDDQTNLFDELKAGWLSTGRAVHCAGSESAQHPLGQYAWPSSPQAAPRGAPNGLRKGGGGGGEDEKAATEEEAGGEEAVWGDGGGASSKLRVCPLPRLPFATGYGHGWPDKWREALRNAKGSQGGGGGGAEAVVLHFNCLGRSGGHDAKRKKIVDSGMWVWEDGGGSTRSKGHCRA